MRISSSGIHDHHPQMWSFCGTWHTRLFHRLQQPLSFVRFVSPLRALLPLLQARVPSTSMFGPPKRELTCNWQLCGSGESTGTSSDSPPSPYGHNVKLRVAASIAASKAAKLSKRDSSFGLSPNTNQLGGLTI